MSNADDTPSKHRGLRPAWGAGQSGNPTGRPKGARTKLGEAFIEALHDDFNEHGIAAIVKVREEKPDQYLKVIASLMPRDLNLTVPNDWDDWSDEQLRERIAILAAGIAELSGPH